MTKANILQDNDLYEWFNTIIYYFHVPLIDQDIVQMGQKVFIRKNSYIRSNAVIVANLVVTKNVLDYCVAVVSQAKVIKNIEKIECEKTMKEMPHIVHYC